MSTPAKPTTTAKTEHSKTPVTPSHQTYSGIERLLDVVAQLREPDGGCPWDLKQTHHSLKRYLLEESYETLEAINDIETPSPKGIEHLKEELGDVLLQIALHAQIAKEANHFDFNDIAHGISEKLIQRHPHVFSDTQVSGEAEVIQNWESIKAQEKAEKAGQTTEKGSDKTLNKQLSDCSILDGISSHLPALMRGTEASQRAVKVGFKWPHSESLWQCVMSEFDEFRQETESKTLDPKRLEDEMGDIFFATISLANHYEVNPETALARGNAKFTKRFQTMEKIAPKPLTELSFDEWDALWRAAKKQTANEHSIR